MEREKLYKLLSEFKSKFPITISWRIKKHADIILRHLNNDEKIIYAFAAQKNDNPLDIITTCVVALTTKRIMIGQKRLLFGYSFYSITPDMFNDLTVKMKLIWGNVYIDTIKELVSLSNIQKDALVEIETNITSYMMEEKKKYKEKEIYKEYENQ